MIDIKKQYTLENEKIDIYSGVDSRYWIIPPGGTSNWVNPPFRKRDAINGHGPTSFVRKGIEESKKGKTSVFILPVQNYVNMLLLAGAEIRPLGRVTWIDTRTGKPMKAGSNNALFILRGCKT